MICTHCGTKYESARETVLCPACGTENPAAAMKCMKCGLNLGKACPICNHMNPPGAEHCMECATPLDMLASISTRKGEGKRLSDNMREQRLVSQKGLDVQYMEEQRRKIDDEERMRQRQLAAQRAEGVRQQRILVVVAIVIVLGMLAAGILFSGILSPK
jgi:hypothetical protein